LLKYDKAKNALFSFFPSSNIVLDGKNDKSFSASGNRAFNDFRKDYRGSGDEGQRLVTAKTLKRFLPLEIAPFRIAENFLFAAKTISPT